MLMVRCCWLLVLVVMLGAVVSPASAKLLTFEGTFEADLEVGVSEGVPVYATHTGVWTVEIAEEDVPTGAFGLADMFIPVQRFEMTPSSYGGVTFNPGNVSAYFTFSQIAVNNRIDRVILGGDGPGQGSAASMFGSGSPDLSLRYSGATQNLTGMSHVGPHTIGIVDAAGASGQMQLVEPDPYLWGEFDVPIEGLAGATSFTGRWALDRALLDAVVAEGGAAYVPLRYFRVTSPMPEGMDFDLRNVEAYLSVSAGKLYRLIIGGVAGGSATTVHYNTTDFVLLYDLWNLDLTTSEESYPMSVTLVNGPESYWYKAENMTGTLQLIPEPTTAALLLAGLGSIALTRRNRDVAR